jgi:YggT family protein
MGEILGIVFWLLQLYQLILLGRVLLSWIPNVDYNNPIVRFLYQATEPVLAPIRKALPAMSGMDLSPLVLFFGISILMRILL